MDYARPSVVAVYFLASSALRPSTGRWSKCIFTDIYFFLDDVTLTEQKPAGKYCTYQILVIIDVDIIISKHVIWGRVVRSG